MNLEWDRDHMFCLGRTLKCYIVLRYQYSRRQSIFTGLGLVTGMGEMLSNNSIRYDNGKIITRIEKNVHEH